jgi:hypothetical protein
VDLSDANYLPSLWRLHKTTALIMLAAIIGTPTLDGLLSAKIRLHRTLANPPRQRKLQRNYLRNALS